jgi:hypothetical protein
MLVLQHLVPGVSQHQKPHKKMDLILKYSSDMDINFRLPEATVFLIAGVFLQICNKGKYITEIKIFYLF